MKTQSNLKILWGIFWPYGFAGLLTGLLIIFLALVFAVDSKGAVEPQYYVETQQSILIITRDELQRRLWREEMYEFFFSFFGEAAGTMYFRGRQDVLREMMEYLDIHAPQTTAPVLGPELEEGP